MDTTSDDSRMIGVRLSTPVLSARLAPATVADALARFVANGEATTRAELGRVTGLSRTTVSSGVDLLYARGVLSEEVTTVAGHRGRPSELLRLDPTYGVVLVADLGLASTRLSLYDLEQGFVASELVAIDLADGPESSVPVIVDVCVRMVAEAAETVGPLTACVVGVPGPVDARRGAVPRPPLLPGWKRYPLAERFEAGLGCTVIVEKDVGLRALGEARAVDRPESPLVYVKVAHGIEAGIVTADGDLYRGADDAAGDLGHIRAEAAGDRTCHCGNTGCLATIASTTALVEARRELLGLSADEATLGAFEDAVRAGETEAVQLLRTAAGAIGDVVAGLVNFFNPSRIVIGGTIAAVSDDVLAGVRSVVYQRSLPLATRHLEVSAPRHGHLSGAAGGLVLALEHLFAVDARPDR